MNNNHITGGGLVENLSLDHVSKKKLTLNINPLDQIKILNCFKWLNR